MSDYTLFALFIFVNYLLITLFCIKLKLSNFIILYYIYNMYFKLNIINYLFNYHIFIIIKLIILNILKFIYIYIFKFIL